MNGVRGHRDNDQLLGHTERLRIVREVRWKRRVVGLLRWVPVSEKKKRERKEAKKMRVRRGCGGCVVMVVE